jgi:hypothetical protein
MGVCFNAGLLPTITWKQHYNPMIPQDKYLFKIDEYLQKPE